MSDKTNDSYEFPSSKFSTNLLMHILATVFLGIFWSIPWVYTTTNLLNFVKGTEKRKPSSKVALFVLVPFYSIYWYRKTAKIIEQAGKQAKVEISFAGICTFFAFFLPAIASIFIQIEIEKLQNKELLFFTPNLNEPRNTSSSVSKSSTAPKERTNRISSNNITSSKESNETSSNTRTVVLPCPNCKEDLDFMGWSSGDEAECPFCKMTFIVK